DVKVGPGSRGARVAGELDAGIRRDVLGAQRAVGVDAVVLALEGEHRLLALRRGAALDAERRMPEERRDALEVGRVLQLGVQMDQVQDLSLVGEHRARSLGFEGSVARSARRKAAVATFGPDR